MRSLEASNAAVRGQRPPLRTPPWNGWPKKTMAWAFSGRGGEQTQKGQGFTVDVAKKTNGKQKTCFCRLFGKKNLEILKDLEVQGWMVYDGLKWLRVET